MITTEDTGREREVNRRAETEIQRLAHKTHSLGDNIDGGEDLLRKQFVAGASTPS
jgi:hypothetical protein